MTAIPTTDCKLPENVSALGLIGTCVVICVAGMLNNLLIIVVVWRNRTMHNPTNFLLSNDAFTEFVYITTSTIMICLIIYIENTPDAFETDELKRVYSFLNTIKALVLSPFYTSAITLAVLAIERYNALIHPMSIHRRLTKRAVKTVIALSWVVAIATTIPLFVPGILDTKRAYLLGTTSFVGAVSHFIITVCYGRIIYGICISKTIFSEVSSATMAQDIKDKKNVVKMLIANTLLFTVTRVPTMGYSVSLLSSDNKQYGCLIYVSLVGHISALCYPLILIFFSKNYRDNVKKMLGSRI